MSINGQGFSPERSHEPLNITSWRRAVVLLIKGKAEQVEHNGKYLYSDFRQPLSGCVIMFVPYKEIPLTRRTFLHRDSHACQYCGYTGII